MFVHIHNTANEGPKRTLLPNACEEVLAPQLGCMFGEKYLPSPDSQISNLPFAHSQPPLPYPGCFPRKKVYVAVNNVLGFRFANQPRHFCLPSACSKSLHQSTNLTTGTQIMWHIAVQKMPLTEYKMFQFVHIFFLEDTLQNCVPFSELPVRLTKVCHVCQNVLRAVLLYLPPV